MEKAVWILLIILAASNICNAAKILVIFPLPGTSHGILGAAVVKHLVNAGHEVTYITPYPKNSTNPKLHEIDVSENVGFFEENTNLMSIKAILEGESENVDFLHAYYIFDMIHKKTLDNKNVQKLLEDHTQHFDLVVVEWLISELSAGYAAVYNAPFIWFLTTEPHWMILSLIDEYTNPAYDGFMVDDTPPFSFIQRLTELSFTITMTIIRETFGNYLQTTGYNSKFVPHIEARGRKAPSFSEVRYNGTLVLGNSHVCMGLPTRLPQSYKPIGGYHVEEDVKPLPDDLQKLLDGAKNGLIYFSMGSILKSKEMPDELKQSLLEVFGSLKQTVLWKFEEKLPNMPKNVHMIKWAPQQSILAHPNCVLFITHGGLLSTTETIFAGKPIIGIPAFADQFMNVARAVNKGFARRVDLSYSMAGQLKEEIEEILSNPKYAQKAKELSFIYHDRPATPSQELVHWVNHVLNTGGAPHLRSAALMVPWYQKCYLDLAVIVILAVLIIKRVIKTMLLVIKPKKSNNSKKYN